MAHHILGVDLGAYSVKVALATPGFRHAAVTRVIERRVPDGDEVYEVRAGWVLAQMLREHKIDVDTPCVAVPGDELFIHVLEFEFSSLRRSELTQVVGGELEGILPIDLEDMVYTFDVLPKDLGVRPDEGDVVELDVALDDEDPTFVRTAPRERIARGRVAAPTTGMRVLTCAMARDRAKVLLARMRDSGIETRSLVAAPASYMRLVERMPSLAHETAPVAVIDVGHVSTNVCVIKQGHVVFARTVTRGGADVTGAIAEAWNLPFEEAEKAKHSDGFIASSAMPASSEAWHRIHEVVVTEMQNLASALRRTLAACTAKTGGVVSRAVIVGGGARLRGAAEYLGEQLGVPVTGVSGDDAVGIFGPSLASSNVSPHVACLAAGVAFEGASGRPTFDLRQGDLAYKADLSFLRSKLTHVAAAALLVIAFMAANAYASLNRVRKSEAALDKRLALETTAAFGKSLDALDTMDKVDEGTVGGGKNGSPLPKMTAYDILLDINSRMPPRDKIKLDVLSVEIKHSRISLKATSGSQEKSESKTDPKPEIKAIDGPALVEKALKGQPCFKQVSPGNISTGTGGVKQFSITIQSKCM